MRWLGVDPGERRVGLAISDPAGRVAVPLEVVPANAAFPAIRAIAAREDVAGIVVGLPLLLDGSEGAAARAARRLGERLQRDGRWPVAYVDERLSSQEAARYRRGTADEMAATILLQSFLDARRAEAARAERAARDAEDAAAPGGPAPGSPAPGSPAPGDPAPGGPAPGGPAPGGPAPGGAAPRDPAPGGAAPRDPAPGGPALDDPAPGDPAPGSPATGSAAPGSAANGAAMGTP